MKKKIFYQNLWLTLTTLLLLLTALSIFLYFQLRQIFYQQLTQENSLVTGVYEKEGFSGLKNLSSTERITLIAPDGTVLYDNQGDATTMENHRQRTEVVAALTKGSGYSQRESPTFLTRNFYYAKKMTDGNVLRLASTQQSFLSLYSQVTLFAAGFFILLLLLLFWAASSLAKKIVTPINQVDLLVPEASAPYPELQPLMRRLQTQNQEIQAQIQRLSQQEQQLTLITNQMAEGLILLDAKDHLLLANPVAQKIFAILPTDFNASYEQIPKLAALYQRLQRKTLPEMLYYHQQRTYQVISNPVEDEKNLVGHVLLLFDITAVAQQEKMRREFTANVTHELKTPLTSISGYAEIIHEGIVKDSDIPRFAGKIQTEAKRLLNLIDDTLKLASLEQKNDLTKETIHWDALLAPIIASLQEKFTAQHQSLTVKTLPIPFSGYPSVLQDVFYNLLENAQKYSGNDKKLSFSMEDLDAEHFAILVANDGPAIPPSEKERIFERFYRGDLSHSSQISGTGLGLAIVKHGVLLHHGKITSETPATGGTLFKIIFPKEKSSE